jgi:small-conductance mechanosensitive channel
MPSWHEIWQTEFLSNTVGDFVLAALAFLVTLTVLPLVKQFIAARRRTWAERHTDPPVPIQLATLLIARTSRVFLWGVALFLASSVLSFPPSRPVAHRIEHAVDIATVFIFWYQLGRWAMAAARFAIDRRHRRVLGSDPTMSGSLEIILFIVSIVVWTMAFLLALDNLGIEIKPLLAGLGIGGIAVALAVQSVLGDLLAGISIALDKPFAIGDSLAIDGFVGTVEHIGVKSTRLRSISGEQIVIANADVLKSRIRNYGRMRERRSAFELNVTYETAPQTLRAIPPAIRAIIDAQPLARFDRCHLLSCGASALVFEVVYFVLVADFRVYADTQQAIIVAILERFRELGVKFATPLVLPTPARQAPVRTAEDASAAPRAPPA